MNSDDDILPPARLRAMQILAGTLLLGVLVFLAIVLIVVSARAKDAGLAPAGASPMISFAAVVMFAVNAPLSFLIPGFVTRTAVRQIASGSWPLSPWANAASYNTDHSKLLAVRQNSLIVGLALLEGAAFFGCIAYLVEAQPFALGVPLAAILLMLVIFPTEARVRAWLQQQAEQLAELRQ